ncbi:MAG TPA: hotdog domain-containing protein [Blastocatellia bacterium]|nr:hotdog domain-containing protein [Blastocatellia bacterium]
MTNPTDRIEIGTEATLEQQVTFEKTIASLREDLPPVFSTPAMIMLMENTAARAIQSLLPDGYISVGTLVSVQHLAPTPVGSIVSSTAKVTAIDDVIITFEVTVTDSTELVGSGTHQRAVIDVDRFMKRVRRKQNSQVSF